MSQVLKEIIASGDEEKAKTSQCSQSPEWIRRDAVNLLLAPGQVAGPGRQLCCSPMHLGTAEWELQRPWQLSESWPCAHPLASLHFITNGQRTVHFVVGSEERGSFPRPPTIGNLYPRFRGPPCKVAATGKMTPSGQDAGPDFPTLIQSGQPSRASWRRDAAHLVLVQHAGWTERVASRATSVITTLRGES